MPSSLSWLAGATVAVTALGGFAAGIGGYTFAFANGASYLTDDARACNNCHVMNEQYGAWLASSHARVATCNDCHTPSNPITKWVAKARNGYHHSRAFTLGGFPDPVRITKTNLEITEGQCRHCHAELASAIDGPHSSSEQRCTSCHRSVGHLH